MAGDIVIGHSMGGVLALRLARDRPRPLRALVLTGCFFPLARNGRSRARTIGDYAAHRVAFVRSIRRRGRVEARGGSAGALASLIRLGAMPAGFDAALAAVAAPLLVVHARDDHHVPIDFALAAVARHPDVGVRVLDRGGHHAHVHTPVRWLEAVTPWLHESAGG